MSEPFRVHCSDPPWVFRDRLPGKTRGASNHYKTTGYETIARFIPPPMHEDSTLFMWRVSAMPEEAYRVIRAWGYVPKSEVVWRKCRPCDHRKTEYAGASPYDWASPLVALDGDRCPVCRKQLTRWFGMGRSTRMEHELCVIAKRGRPQRVSKSIRSVFTAPLNVAKDGHSTKPEAFYRSIVEKLFDGPYVETFARRQRSGWSVLGDEVGFPLDLLA